MSNALQIALTGMNAVRVKTDNEGNNLANIQTPGYTNKVIETTSVLVDGLGSGVRVGPAKRLLEANLAKESRDQISTATHLDVTATLLKQIEKEFGSIGDKNALPDLIKNFSNACDRLATSPTDSLARKDVIRAADIFSQEIARISHQIQKLRQDVDAKIAIGVKDINLNLENIYSLNKTIIRNAGAGKSTADLEDLRDQSLRTIAKHIDISTSVTDSGAMYVQTASGHALLFPAVIPISYTATTVMNATSTYDPNPLLTTINPITVAD
jgi:flagellar hook-associated protein 1 FlgK